MVIISGSAKPVPWSSEETCQILANLFGPQITHSFYKCASKCSCISTEEVARLGPKKFSHGGFINRTNWWLVYVEGEGMYCLVCKKHMMKHPQNKREVFSGTPSVRFKNDAITTHRTSKLHEAAIENEFMQKGSCFHQEYTKQSDLEYGYLEKAFSVAYFLMKEFIANNKFKPLLNFIQQVSGDETLRFFKHRSEGSRQEMFQTIGETIKSEIVENVKKAEVFGLLTDEVCDISVTENLVTFVQFYCASTKQVETKFLSCQDILSEFSSANAVAIKSLLCTELTKHGLDVKKLTGFASDGAAVMTGKNRGVAALLREETPSMVNIHCVCHRLALACTGSNESLNYIKTVETLLRQLWQFFENSPKNMAAYLKMQTTLKTINLSQNATKTVSRRLKKACRTRWLSFDSAVKAVRLDYESIMQTLLQLDENDATAHGLLKRMKTLKFLGTIYILNEILPILSDLSRPFQQDSLNFSAILPAVNLCKSKLN